MRASLAAAIDATLDTPNFRNWSEPTLNIVLESGHKNAPDAVRLYNDLEKRFASKGREGALNGITCGSKESCFALAAADDASRHTSKNSVHKVNGCP